jgi:FAD synthase
MLKRGSMCVSELYGKSIRVEVIKKLIRDKKFDMNL